MRRRTQRIGFGFALMVTASAIAACYAPLCYAQTLVIGATGYSSTEGFLARSAIHPVDQLLRDATGAPLIDLPRSVHEQFRLRLADQVQVSADYRNWSFRILSSATHSSGERISALDVASSLERCHRGGGLAALRAVELREPQPGGESEEWVELQFELKSGGISPRDLVPALVNCPVYQESSTRLFGESFGIGSNIVGPGYYRMSDFTAGRSLRLKLFEGAFPPVGAFKNLEVKLFADDRAALSSLRAGGADAILNPSQEVQLAAQDDGTLGVTRCDTLVILHRKDLVVPCGAPVRLAEIRYVS